MNAVQLETNRMNRFLASNGLGTLDEGVGLMAQMGFLIQDHDHFREMLIACEPALRHDMYEALHSHLRFEAKPLDVYIAEAGRIAEAKQLPIQAEDGKLYPFRGAQVDDTEERVNPDIAIAQEAVTAALAKGALELTCRKCTTTATFPGRDRASSIRAAREAGWTYGLDTEGKGREICPACD